jgi:hypothetical protein
MGALATQRGWVQRFIQTTPERREVRKMFNRKMGLEAISAGRIRPVRSALLIACSVAAVACSTNAPPYSESIAGETLDIAVRHWRTDKMDTDYSGPTDFGQILAEYIAGSLQENGYRAVAVPRDAPLPAGTRYEFDGSFETLDSGSWNLRFWIGFGAGHAIVNASGTLTEVASGKTVLREAQRARSNTWQFQENILRRTCSRVARAFAKDIKKTVQP